ncbi:hypothetical protein [Natronolimnobius baerhuensis]|uniref:Uncharacterized protein n=1 Tax=Natronolimnobius baerhuensis TaxID=253108 RepID=A0A202E9A5_9EURY|nr:hypothetical protein [Natronolimnobius baerhuensis]OVE84856.1 hypothetical protein B2G88_10805 [Natronolimnobius baerhuensis]
MQSHDTAENKASARESYRPHTLPTLRTDGGQNPPATPAFTLTLEYTTMDGRRQRVTYVPATDADDARRITHERDDSKWRETSRQPISRLAVHLQNHAGGSGDYYAGP